MIKILIGVAIVILLFIIIFVIYGNRFNFAIIKINEAESNLDILLNRKLDLS